MDENIGVVPVMLILRHALADDTVVCLVFQARWI